MTKSSFHSHESLHFNRTDGDRVMDGGKVHHVGKTRSGSIQFINFQKEEKGPFIGIVKRENLEAVEEALGGGLKSSLAGKTFELRGEIILYGEIPEIVVLSGIQVRVVED